MKTNIENLIVEFFANSTTTEKIANELNINNVEELKNTLHEAQREWDDVDCSPEGATKEQDIILDGILEKTKNEILKIK